MTRRWEAIKQLRKQRSRSWFVRFSMSMMVMMTVFAWVKGPFSVGEILLHRRLYNLARFVNETQPNPWGPGCSGIVVTWRWARDLVIDRGFDATVTTAAIAVASIVLAGAVAMVLAMPASRTIASPEAFAISGMAAKRIERWLWASLVAMTRAVLILARGIPEYIWAFLFLAIWGPTAGRARIGSTQCGCAWETRGGSDRKYGTGNAGSLASDGIYSLEGSGSGCVSPGAAPIFPLFSAVGRLV